VLGVFVARLGKLVSAGIHIFTEILLGASAFIRIWRLILAPDWGANNKAKPAPMAAEASKMLNVRIRTHGQKAPCC
jgi:hypothetical protein